MVSKRPQQQGQDKKQTEKKGKEKLEERRPRQNYEQVGLQEAPHLQDLKQNHFENAKSKNSKKEFFFNRKSKGRKIKPLKTEVDQAMV